MTDETDDFLTRLAAAEPALERIETTGLGVVYMRRQSADDQWRIITLQRELEHAGRGTIPPAAVVAWALVKEDGTPQFEDLAEGFKRLGRVKKEVLSELYEHALRITGLGAEAMELAEKKSLSSQSSVSGTNSPS